MEEWWRKSVVYQIYPKSFNDTTGNGKGDLRGIIDRLDYLKLLGIDVIWMTPIYQSPQRDNGYDISNYFTIQDDYGSMEDFEALVEEAHARDIKIIMDIVVNHTSTEHEWFQRAKLSKQNPYRDYYIWRKPVAGKEPNNWKSKFGGSAWELDETSGDYYLHLFDVTQADLNWENEDVRNDVQEMMHFWFQKGVDGFRLDVINLISKDQSFPDDDGTVSPGDGRRFYTDGPRVHEYLQELNRKVFSHYDCMTVGEMSSTSISECIRYSNPENRELSMTFNFHHLKVDYPNGEKWAVGEMDFLALKRILSEWQVSMHKGGGWNALFWCNHDQPRAVSRYGDDQKYHKESAKMLAAVLHMMQGTPYIYQGEEFGMTNPDFSSINCYRDVETLNIYQTLKEQGLPEQEVMEIIKQKSRDNGRTPMQWSDRLNAGFTTGSPWIPIAGNYEMINAEQALEDKDSIFHFYQELIRIRKEYDIVTYGDYQLLFEDHPEAFVYKREHEGEVLLSVNNFYGHETKVDMSGFQWDSQTEVLIANYGNPPALFGKITLRPYESVIYHMH